MTALALKAAGKADLFQDEFAAHAAELPGAGLSWLDARRKKAIDAFAQGGLPSRRVEAWKYTDLAASLESGLEHARPSHGKETAGSVFAGLEALHLLLVNGFLQTRPDNLPEGLEIVDLSVLDARTAAWVNDNLGRLAAGIEQPMGAASLALMRGGVAVHVRGHITVPLHLAFLAHSDGSRSVGQSRVLVVMEENSSLSLLESHSDEGAGQSLANIGIEFVVKAGARLEHVRLQAGGDTALHVTSLGGSIAREGSYRALYAALGGKLSRLDIDIRLAASGAQANLRNVAVVNRGIADITTVMDHASPDTTSRQLFKSVIGGRGRSVAQGRVTVREGAVKSDSHQLFKSLLLSPQAEADAKPELEIYADDVICGHGTAIGALDEDALFYLRARGIPEAEARGLLMRAFLEEVVDGFASPEVHDALWRALDAALAAQNRGEP